jgi:MoaA/NifB/PqqE/SkfB family radical SAM enzyme
LKTADIFRSWGMLLSGRKPALSIEITKECPLHCPGCYAYGDGHLGEGMTNLRQLSDFKGAELVSRFLAVVDEHKPIHLSIVGGDPLVRYRELNEILPQLESRGIHVQLVTSAFRELPAEWAKLKLLYAVVSIDGLAPEHDKRRTPATYERILKNIRGHNITVHCTITSQMMKREGYLEQFLEFWDSVPETKRIWMSMFTPQIGERSEEILSREERERAIADLLRLRHRFPKLEMNGATIKTFAHPPATPKDCIFAQTTHSISADLKTVIEPCQFGGNPDCSQCGCIASMGMEALGQHRTKFGIQVRDFFRATEVIGNAVARSRRKKQVQMEVLPILTARTAHTKTAAADSSKPNETFAAS